MSEAAPLIDGPPATFSLREWPRPWMGKFLDALAVQPVVATAARAAAINRQYAYEAADIWPEFKAGWIEAQAVGVELLESNTVRWATVGMDIKEITIKTDKDGNVIEKTERTGKHMSPTLAIFVLKRFKPEYRDTHVHQHTGPGGGPVQVEVDRMPTHQRMLELAELAQLLELPPVIEGTATEIE